MSVRSARAIAPLAPRRAKMLFAILLVAGLALGGRLADVQIRRGPVLAREALSQRATLVDSFARRGTIRDRDGGVLARSLPSESVYAVPTSIGDAHEVAARVAASLHRPAAPLETTLRERAEFRWLARKVSHETAERVRALGIVGINVAREETGVRDVPSGRLASTLLGFVGTDENGLAGLEYGYDRLLRGKPGRVRIEADQFGRAIPIGQETVVERAVPGRTIVTTLDPYLQYQAERTLRAQVARYHARSGSAIVMDPWSGELLAVANAPDFEPGRFDAFPRDAWRDRAVEDAYEPGSTFKLITAAAALESGRMRADSRVPARDALEVGGRTIHNAEDGLMAGSAGSESLEDVIAYSHNVGAAEIGLAVGPRALDRTIRAFGFGEPTRIEVPGENPGIVPAPSDYSGSTLATISFGHGISTTPIALVRAYAAIANGGLLLRPRVVHAIEDDRGRVVYRYGPAIERRAISPATAATLRRFLRAVVVRGTGNPTAQVAGYTTAGKTGTAQVVENGRYEPGAYIASFVGYVPADHPKYVILVKVERPHGAIYGSVVAAPVFADLAKAAMLHAGIFPAATPAPRPSPASKVAHR